MSALVSTIAELIPRHARVAHRCRTCRAEIATHEPYLEYVGESTPFHSGVRYCLSCGLKEWGKYLEVSP